MKSVSSKTYASEMCYISYRSVNLNLNCKWREMYRNKMAQEANYNKNINLSSHMYTYPYSVPYWIKWFCFKALNKASISFLHTPKITLRYTLRIYIFGFSLLQYFIQYNIVSIALG